MNRTRIAASAFGSCAALMAGLLGSPTAPARADEYSPPVRSDVPRQVFWGDTHLHSRLSADAYSVGNTTHAPDDAYRLARGETIVAQNGMQVKLRRPLDFLVVSDHAEYLGILAGVEDGDEAVLDSRLGRKLRPLYEAGKTREFIGALMSEFSAISFSEEVADRLEVVNVEPDLRRSIWQGVGERADRFDVPGHFTAFVGYEYTSMPGLANLHRIVLFRDGASRTSRILPFSALDSRNPEDLWRFMADYERETGGSVLAIPHNSNLSAGRMFEETRYDGSPITSDWARARARWEPLHEMTQIKGDSETHPVLSPNDEFADYETWKSWSGGDVLPPGTTEADWRRTAAGSYARSALERGLEIEGRVGANPYKFGMIGSDRHAHRARDRPRRVISGASSAA